MDDKGKKLFAQFDDDAPMCGIAFEAWREHEKKQGRSARDTLADINKVEELEKTLADFAEANEEAEKNEAELRRRNAELRAALWIKVNWKISGAIAAGVLVVGVCGWAYEHYNWAYPEPVMAGLRSSVASATWGEGWSEPVASKVAGQPWWQMFYGDIDATSFSDGHGNPIEMRCLHVYAAPAEPYASGQFMKGFS